MANEALVIETLGEQVGAVEVGVHIVRRDRADRDELSDLEEATIDVPRTMARLAVLGQVERT